MFEDQTKKFINKIKKNKIDKNFLETSLQLISLIEKIKEWSHKKK